MKLAMDKVRELKPNVKVWWTAGAQPPQLLSTGELAMSSAWSGRVLAIMKENAPVAMTYEDGIAWGNAWVVPKGTPNAKLAMEAINYALSPEAQARLLDFGTYGPVLGEGGGEGDARAAQAPGHRAREHQEHAHPQRGAGGRPIRRNTKPNGTACSSVDRRRS